MFVLLEGDMSKNTVGRFHLPLLDGELTNSQKSDEREIQFVPYDQVDWTYPNIILVLGQESHGLSYAIASKARVENNYGNIAINFKHLIFNVTTRQKMKNSFSVY